VARFNVRSLLLALALAAVPLPVTAAVQPFPKGFAMRDVAVEGAVIHMRIGGRGPTLVLLHGFGDTGDMWAPVAARLADRYTMIVPDLRGMGLSSHPEQGYDKKTQARDVAQLLSALKLAGPVYLVTHDLGNMVGYAFAAQSRDRVVRWVVMDAPLPGVGHWDDVLKDPKTWHFNFYGPDEERLVAGRERIYLDRFYNELSADPKHIDEATRRHYAALYSRPGAMHDAFAQFAAFPKDGIDNRAFLAAGKLTMPILAIGGEKSFGTSLADEIRVVASDVSAVSIPDAGHWLMEEQPERTVDTIAGFLAKPLGH
jgi:pimeloyl-ACP methyl ester carboxylesterase